MEGRLLEDVSVSYTYTTEVTFWSGTDSETSFLVSESVAKGLISSFISVFQGV